MRVWLPHLMLAFALWAPVCLWTDVAKAADPVCTRMAFEGSGFLVCPYEPRRDSLRLVWAARDGSPLGGFARLGEALGAAAGRLRFAMNAGMYAPDLRPVGLYVEHGTERHAINLRDGDGNFALKPNGVFWMDAKGGAHVEETVAFLAGHRSAFWATQSGPMLVIDDKLHPKIAPDGPSRNIRNGVGVKNGGEAVFVISESAVSFGRLARFFLTDLHCRNALYFDGTISSLWVPGLGRRDDAYPLGPMVAVLGKK